MQVLPTHLTTPAPTATAPRARPATAIGDLSVKIVTVAQGGVAQEVHLRLGKMAAAREVGTAVIVCAAIVVVVVIQHAQPSSIVLEGDDDFSTGYVLGCALRAKERVGSSRGVCCLLSPRTGVDWEPKPVTAHTHPALVMFSLQGQGDELEH